MGMAAVEVVAQQSRVKDVGPHRISCSRRPTDVDRPVRGTGLLSARRQLCFSLPQSPNQIKNNNSDNNEMKTPTDRQIEALKTIGVTEIPETRRAAQALLAKHYGPTSKRGRASREVQRRKKQDRPTSNP
jgi:hypothetical protein